MQLVQYEKRDGERKAQRTDDDVRNSEEGVLRQGEGPLYVYNMTIGMVDDQDTKADARDTHLTAGPRAGGDDHVLLAVEALHGEACVLRQGIEYEMRDGEIKEAEEDVRLVTTMV